MTAVLKHMRDVLAAGSAAMAAFLTSVCVLASVTSLHTAIGTLTTMLSSGAGNNYPTVKNKTFVDVIKETLRRNNDDYAIGDQLDGDIQPPVKTRRQMNDSEQIVEFKDETEISPATPSLPALESTVFRSGMKEFVRKKKHEHHLTRKHSTHEAISTTESPQGETDRKTQLDKWKHLMAKSNRPRMHASSPKIELSPVARVSRNHNVMRTASGTKTEATTTTAASTTTRLRPRQAPNVAILPLRSPGPVRVPPSADQLDMAPARGAYIHDMRLKGRFCYRHVLWPEGPKYNSKGETIMPAFNSSIYRGRKRFFETAKPIFVLPRCCNCCKKSVLGCQ